jgi:hypothetical protein
MKIIYISHPCVVIRPAAEANECVVVTDNGKDLAGLKIINPLRDVCSFIDLWTND